jgi:hypothetical protein
MNDEDLKCDFCSALAPTWAYPAKDFIAYLAVPLVGESVGAWAACEECHRLIEAGDREGLAVRSLDELVFRCPEAAIAAPALTRELRQLHELFFANRLGIAVRTVAEPV